MNKKISLGITIGLMAITAAVTFIITGSLSLRMFNDKLKSVSEKQDLYSKLSEIDTYVRSNCINEIDEKALTEGIVAGYIDGISDVYAEYLTAEQNARINDEAAGVFVSLGFDYEKEPNGYIRVTSIIGGSSAEEAGLLKDDIITAVNNTDVIAYEGGYDEAVSIFKCDEGTKVKLNVKRTMEDNTSEFLTYEVIAQMGEKNTVSGKFIEECGYIRITAFNDRTEAQVKTKIDELKELGATSFIFDVRNTTGGSMAQIGACLEHIIGSCEAVTATYKNGTTEAVITTSAAEMLDMPIVVLVNQNTADGAEIFAFALRDEAGAQCVGKTTAGHGYLQEKYKCSDGTVIKLSVAVLQTKTSGNFEGIGLKPEYDAGISSDIDIDRLSVQAAMLSDNQLIKAVEVAKQGWTDNDEDVVIIEE